MLRSFDILRDDLGGPRSAFPHTVTLAAGIQAAHPKQSALALMKLSNLGQGKHGSKARAPYTSREDPQNTHAPPCTSLLKQACAHVLLACVEAACFRG